jgi:carbohydrate-selective porin OprB
MPFCSATTAATPSAFRATGNRCIPAGRVARDGNYAFECFYRIVLSDHIAITPAFFYLSRPQGQDTGVGNSFRSYGVLIQSTFVF